MYKWLFCILLCFGTTVGINKNLTTFPGFQYNKRTQNEIFRILSPIGAHQCARECMSRKHCYAVNFDRSQLRCQLSYRPGRHNSLNDYIEDADFITFNPKPERSYVHSCASTTACNENYKCVVNKQGTPSCLLSECPDPRELWTNVQIFNLDYGIGSHVFINCASYDYSRIDGTDSEKLTCGKDGKWIYDKSKDLNCLRRCKDPTTIWQNIVVTGNQFLAGKFVNITCDANHYSESGSSNPVSLVCGQDGNWENPNNFEITCFRKCDDPFMNWQHVSVSGAISYGQGKIRKITCAHGYMREDGTDDAVTIRCEHNGVWSWQPQDRILECTRQRVYCVNPEFLSWNIQLIHAMGTEFTEGSEAVIKCLHGFQRTDDTSITGHIYCNSQGQWAPDNQACPLKINVQQRTGAKTNK